MQIIDQYHVIEHITPNILQQIEMAARNCYKSEEKMGCSYNGPSNVIEKTCLGHLLESDGTCKDTDCEYHSAQKFVKMIINNGHHAMLEFGDIAVRLITNRGVTHELVRHRIGMSYAQESTRYVRYDDVEFIKPVWDDFDTTKGYSTAEMTWVTAMMKAEMYYQNLITLGWRPEHAREVLPNSLKTEIVVKGNVRAWRHVFQLRTTKKAHPQIRSLMLNLLNDLKKQIPVVFDDIGEQS